MEQSRHCTKPPGPGGRSKAAGVYRDFTAGANFPAQLRSAEYPHGCFIDRAVSFGEAGEPRRPLSHRLSRTRRCQIEEAFRGKQGGSTIRLRIRLGTISPAAAFSLKNPILAPRIKFINPLSKLSLVTSILVPPLLHLFTRRAFV